MRLLRSLKVPQSFRPDSRSSRPHDYWQRDGPMYRIMSRAKRLEGRKYFSFFEFINTLSFSFLAGNVLTLLMLRLGAGDALIGLLNSFVYLSFFFMPIGRSQVHKIGVVKNFSRSWLIRYLSMIPLIV